MTEECNTADLAPAIADLLGDDKWWDTLSPADQNLFLRGAAAAAAAPTGSRERVYELAVRLHRRAMQTSDPLGVRALIKRVDGTKCQQSLLREVIAEIGRRKKVELMAAVA